MNNLSLFTPALLKMNINDIIAKMINDANAFIYWVNVLKTLKADIVKHADGTGASCADGGG